MNPNKVAGILAGAMLLTAMITGCGSREKEALPPAEQEILVSGLPENSHVDSEETRNPFTLGLYTRYGLNPYTTNNTTNQAICSLLYEPLFRMTPSFSAEPCLAERCYYNEEGTWTIVLRRDAVFWDGTPVTALDVMRSLKKAAQPGSIYETQLKPMGELIGLDDHSFQLRWDRPCGDLAVMLEIPIVSKDTLTKAVPMGSGCYQPVYEEEKLSYLVPSQTYIGDRVPLDEIHLFPVSDSDVLIYGFESGQVSLVVNDLTGTNSLGYTGSFEVYDYPTTYLLYLGCNTANGIAANSDFRTGLDRILDRELIADSLLSGHAVPTDQVFHPASSLYSNVVRATPEEELLSDLSGQTVRILVNAESEFKRAIAEYIAGCLTEYGLEAVVDCKDWNIYQQCLTTGEYDIYLGEIKLNPDFDPTVFFDLDGGVNFSKFHSDEIDAALNDYLIADATERSVKAAALTDAILKEVPILPLCFEEHSIFTQWGSLTAYQATQTSLFYHFEDWVMVQDQEGK